MSSLFTLSKAAKESARAAIDFYEALESLPQDHPERQSQTKDVSSAVEAYFRDTRTFGSRIVEPQQTSNIDRVPPYPHQPNDHSNFIAYENGTMAPPQAEGTPPLGGPIPAGASNERPQQVPSSPQAVLEGRTPNERSLRAHVTRRTLTNQRSNASLRGELSNNANGRAPPSTDSNTVVGYSQIEFAPSSAVPAFNAPQFTSINAHLQQQQVPQPPTIMASEPGIDESGPSRKRSRGAEEPFLHVFETRNDVALTQGGWAKLPREPRTRKYNLAKAYAQIKGCSMKEAYSRTNKMLKYNIQDIIPGFPHRPSSAFFIFANSTASRGPGINAQESMKRLSVKWKTLSEEEKEPYVIEHNERVREYKKEKDEFSKKYGQHLETVWLELMLDKVLEEDGNFDLLDKRRMEREKYNSQIGLDMFSIPATDKNSQSLQNENDARNVASTDEEVPDGASEDSMDEEDEEVISGNASGRPRVEADSDFVNNSDENERHMTTRTRSARQRRTSTEQVPARRTRRRQVL